MLLLAVGSALLEPLVKGDRVGATAEVNGVRVAADRADPADLRATLEVVGAGPP